MQSVIRGPRESCVHADSQPRIMERGPLKERHMTRETKIGLIVAGSFLCLVCIVIASKWRRGDDPSKEPEGPTVPVAAVNPTQNTKTPQAKTKDEAQSDGPTSPVALIKLPPPPETDKGARGHMKPETPAPTAPVFPPRLSEQKRMEI